MTSFVAATGNLDKLREIVDIMGDAFELLPRPEGLEDPEEDAKTLVENARIKAAYVMEATGMPAIADDTGLEVDALGGAPGVKSARFAGENATYEENVALLLRCLQELEEASGHGGKGQSNAIDRTSRFKTIALAIWPDGREEIAEGIVEGKIAEYAKGTSGFGYDPIFIPNAVPDKTLAQMTATEKNTISARGLAFTKLRETLDIQNG